MHVAMWGGGEGISQLSQEGPSHARPQVLRSWEVTQQQAEPLRAA